MLRTGCKTSSIDIRIRQVPKPTGLILLRNRLTGAARKWMQSLPASADFDDTIRRFRARFTHNAGRRDELMDTFWNRRQGADEPVSTYIEDMVGIARRMQLDNEPLMRQGIIQGLRPEIRRDVRVLRPTNLEELAEAAAIGEANAKLMHTRTRAADAAVSAQLAEMREMMASMQVMMSTQNANTVNAPPQHPPRTTTTTTATATHYHQNVAATAATSAPAPSVPQNMTVQLVMPEPIAAQYGGGRGGPGGRGGRGRGRGWRGPWRGPPPNRRPVDATAPAFQNNAGLATTGTPADNITGPPCDRCGRTHAAGNCLAVNASCFECGLQGHFARCCMYRQGLPTQH